MGHRSSGNRSAGISRLPRFNLPMKSDSEIPRSHLHVQTLNFADFHTCEAERSLRFQLPQFYSPPRSNLDKQTPAHKKRHAHKK